MGENEARILSREEALDDLRDRVGGDGEYLTNHHWDGRDRRKREEVLRCPATMLLSGLGSCRLPFSYFVHGETAHIVTGYSAESAVTRAEELIEELGPVAELTAILQSPERVRSLLEGMLTDGRDVALLGEHRRIPAQEALRMLDEAPGIWRLAPSWTMETVES